MLFLIKIGLNILYLILCYITLHQHTSCGVPFFKRTWPYLIRERFSSMPYWCLHSSPGDSFPRVWLYNGKYLICCSYIEPIPCELQCLLFFFYKTLVTGDDYTITPEKKKKRKRSTVFRIKLLKVTARLHNKNKTKENSKL